MLPKIESASHWYGLFVVYLDWNATTPLHPKVRLAMEEAAGRAWANPASLHRAGRAARDELESTREVLGAALGFHPRDIAFTGSGTEANNLALHDVSALVTSRLEHPSVTALAAALEQRGVPVIWVPVPPTGRLDPDAVEAALEQVSGLEPTVAVMAVNHETGVLQPLEAIAERVRRAGGRLHVDAVQLVGRGPLQALAFADTVSVAAHKIRGPKGIGALLWRATGAPRPLLRGGAQERGLRPGTLDAVSAAGFRVALERLAESAIAYGQLAPLRDMLEAGLASWAIPNGQEPRLGHITNLSVHDWRGDEVVAALDLEGVCVSSGSACSAGTTEASPVITAMLGPERAGAAVRLSLGEDTTHGDAEMALQAFQRVLGDRGTLGS